MEKRNTDMTVKQPKAASTLLTEIGADTGISLTEHDLKKVMGGFKLPFKLS